MYAPTPPPQLAAPTLARSPEKVLAVGSLSVPVKDSPTETTPGNDSWKLSPLRKAGTFDPIVAIAMGQDELSMVKFAVSGIS